MSKNSLIELEKSIDLDEDLIDKLSNHMEDAINCVLNDEPDKDGRIELLTIVLSLASQLSVELDVEYSGFIDMAASFYNEARQEDGEHLDISKLN